MMGVPTPTHREDLDVSDATFARPDLTTFARLDDLGLEVIGQRLEPDRAVLACRVVEPDEWCRRCGCEGVARDTVTREIAVTYSISNAPRAQENGAYDNTESERSNLEGRALCVGDDG